MTDSNTTLADVDSLLSRLDEFFRTRQVKAYLVGGYVRDSLLRLPAGQDVDLAVEADPYRLGPELADWAPGRFCAIGPSPRRGADRNPRWRPRIY